MLADELPGMDVRSPQSLGGSPVSIHLYVEDADAIFTRRSRPVPQSSGRWPASSMAIVWAELKIRLDIRGGSQPTRKDLSAEEIEKRAAVRPDIRTCD
jgi:PhnB protein